jgi:uncharacterized protein (TIGR02246 family)
VPFVIPPLQPGLQFHQAEPDDGSADRKVSHQQRTHLKTLLRSSAATTRHFNEKFTAAPSILSVANISDLPSDDQQAIGKTLLTLLAGFQNRDAQALRAVYSEDADWVNAFGTVKRGREAIVAYLTGLFADDNFNRGEPDGPPETSFRVLSPDVVLVSAHLRIKGQGLLGGGTLDRDNFSLRALQRQSDGSWLIVSEMFQDANTETTYAQ